MRTIALTGLLSLLTFFTTGCVSDNVEREGLPTGATLLDSDEASCDGIVELEGNSDVAVGEGESKTFAIDDEDDMDWQCVSDSSVQKGGDLDCPDGTDYVRITRNEDEDDFRIECYGS